MSKTIGSIKAIKSNFGSLLSNDDYLILLHRLLFNGESGSEATRRKSILGFKGGLKDSAAVLEQKLEKWTVTQLKAVMKILAISPSTSGALKSDHVASISKFLTSFSEDNNEDSGNDSAAEAGDNEASASASSTTSSKKRRNDDTSSGLTPRSKRKSSFREKAEAVLLVDFPYLRKKPVTLKNLSTDLWGTLPSDMKKAEWYPGISEQEGGGGGGGAPVIASSSGPTALSSKKGKKAEADDAEEPEPRLQSMATFDSFIEQVAETILGGDSAVEGISAVITVVEAE
jgi:hypothetical protein